MIIDARIQAQGIFFVGRVGRMLFGMRRVKLFVEGQKRPVGTIKFSSLDAFGDNATLVDRAFQQWITDGLFYKTIKDIALLSILEIARRERLEGVEWYRRTHRFLTAEGCTYQNPRFILTTDKSDLPNRYKRILEVGEEFVQREEAEQEEARKLRAKEERDHEENLRTKHAQLIIAVAKAAINEKSVLANDIRMLSELGLLKSSTSFRGGALFPGESSILWYDFTKDETRYTGYIGFDADLKLLSVEERCPRYNKVYLR